MLGFNTLSSSDTPPNLAESLATRITLKPNFAKYLQYS